MYWIYSGTALDLHWCLWRGVSAQIAADLPVSIVSSGQQLVPDYRIRGAITWQF